MKLTKQQALLFCNLFIIIILLLCILYKVHYISDHVQYL